MDVVLPLLAGIVIAFVIAVVGLYIIHLAGILFVMAVHRSFSGSKRGRRRRR